MKEGPEKRMKLTEYQDAMTIADICEFLGISRGTAYRFIRKSKIKYMLVGREYRISKISLAEHLGLNITKEAK